VKALKFLLVTDFIYFPLQQDCGNPQLIITLFHKKSILKNLFHCFSCRFLIILESSPKEFAGS